MSTKNTLRYRGSGRPMVCLLDKEERPTDGQVEHIKQLSTKPLSGLYRHEAQAIIRTGWLYQRYLDKMIASLARRLRNRDIIEITVDFDREPEEVFANFEPSIKQRKDYHDILAAIPRGGNGRSKVRLEFFNLGLNFEHEDLDKICRGLRYNRLAGPYELAEANRVRPSFAIHKPNTAHWQDEKERWNVLMYYRSRTSPKRVVGVTGLLPGHNDPYQWFAGVLE